MATTFVDIDRARLLDVVPDRSGDVVRDWVTERPDGRAGGIQVATIDEFRGNATAIGDVLPCATSVIDHFHAIRLASSERHVNVSSNSASTAWTTPLTSGSDDRLGPDARSTRPSTSATPDQGLHACPILLIQAALG
jgi:hypothetical protein